MRAMAKHDSEAPDTALLKHMAAGNEEAFVTLVRRYQDRFHAVARRMLGDDAEAQDAVQTAFFHVYRGAAAYRDDWRGSTWLYRILTNVCIDLWRKRRRLEGAGKDIATAVAAPRDVEGIDIDRALAKLPPEARAILLLCYVEDLSYADVARIRGISVNTVKTQLLRAKRLMRRHLSEVKT